MKVCPENLTNIGLLAADELSGKDAEALRKHMKECWACNTRYMELCDIRQSLEMLADVEPTTPLPISLSETIILSMTQEMVDGRLSGKLESTDESWRLRWRPDEATPFFRLLSTMGCARLRQLAMLGIIAGRRDLADAVEKSPRRLAEILRKAKTMNYQQLEAEAERLDHRKAAHAAAAAASAAAAAASAAASAASAAAAAAAMMADCTS